MPEPTIGLAMIVRDAGASLGACLASVLPYVDEAAIVFAGKSKDDTEAIVSRFAKAKKAPYKLRAARFDWIDDFSAARNFSFSMLTSDWIIWLDADDLVVNGEKLRYLAAEGESRGYGAFHLPYNYRHDDRGEVTVVHTRERLLRRSLGWTWKNRVHEFCNAATEHLVGFADDVVIKHTNNVANTERNLRLLEMMAAETPETDPEYPRLLGCFQDIYQSQGMFEKAIEYGERHFASVPDSVVRWTAATELARSNQGLQNWDEVFRWALSAIAIHPEFSLPYLLMAHAAWHGEQNADKALLFLSQADGLEQAPLNVFRQPQDYTIRRWDVEHRCYADKGDWQRAFEVVQQAEEHLGFLKKDRPQGWGGWDYFSWYYIERLNCERSVAGATAIVDHLFRRGDTLRARRFMETSLPLPIREDPRILGLYERVCALTAHVMGDEAGYGQFYEDNHYDKANPDNMLNGIMYEPYRMNIILERLKAIGARRVLDVGCGAGAADFFLAEHGFKVVGIDINPAAIDEARRLVRKHFPSLKRKNGAGPMTAPEFHLGTLETIGPEDLGRFDAVLMMELIEHLPPEKVPLYFSSAEDFVYPGGSVMFTCPGMLVGDIPGVWSEFPRDHVQEFTRQDLERLLLESPSRRLKLPVNLRKVYDPAVSVPGFASWFGEYAWYPEGQPPMPEAFGQPVQIYVGTGLELWDPTTPEEKGLGGSETWAIKVARELRALGHRVVVYANAEGVWDGVVYRHASKFDPTSRSWLTIVSRYLESLDTRPNAEHVLFVAHDTDYGDQLTPGRLANMDAYCVMSEWQRGHTLERYAGDSGLISLPSKLRVIANGIEPAFFEGKEERKGHSFVWSSSPDRGLDVLLGWWPAIREMWADATLDVYYGFDNMTALTPGRPWLPPFMAKVKEALRQPGVKLVGRVGQKRLAREMMKHQFWLYPATNAFGEPWHETFCITAVEAAAGGCAGIFPKVGALTERPGFRVDKEQMSLEDALAVLKATDCDQLVNPDALATTWRRAAELLLEALPAPAPITERELVTA